MGDALGYATRQGPALVIWRTNRDTYRGGAYGGFTATVASVADPSICWNLYCRESNGGDGRCRDCRTDVLGRSRVGRSCGGSAREGLVAQRADEMMASDWILQRLSANSPTAITPRRKLAVSWMNKGPRYARVAQLDRAIAS